MAAYVVLQQIMQPLLSVFKPRTTLANMQNMFIEDYRVSRELSDELIAGCSDSQFRKTYMCYISRDRRKYQSEVERIYVKLFLLTKTINLWLLGFFKTSSPAAICILRCVARKKCISYESLPWTARFEQVPNCVTREPKQPKRPIIH